MILFISKAKYEIFRSFTTLAVDVSLLLGLLGLAQDLFHFQ